MGLFVPSKRPAPRRFQYEPRYYDPSRDDSLRQRLRINRKARKRGGGPTKALYLGILLVIVLYILNVLANSA